MTFLHHWVQINLWYKIKTLYLFGQFACYFMIECPDVGSQITHFTA